MEFEYMMTYTGKHFHPLDPQLDEICIEDIAHALSLICRGGGHFKQFFSVAQHCLCCAREAKAQKQPLRIQLACLLHDAAEAYYCDLPKPVKERCNGYAQMEDRMLDIIFAKYLPGGALTAGEWKKVKEIDKLLLKYDLHEFLGYPAPQDAISTPPDYGSYDPYLIEQAFLMAYDDLSGALKLKR